MDNGRYEANTNVLIYHHCSKNRWMNSSHWWALTIQPYKCIYSHSTPNDHTMFEWQINYYHFVQIAQHKFRFCSQSKISPRLSTICICCCCCIMPCHAMPCHVYRIMVIIIRSHSEAIANILLSHINAHIPIIIWWWLLLFEQYCKNVMSRMSCGYMDIYRHDNIGILLTKKCQYSALLCILHTYKQFYSGSCICVNKYE